jgi:putative transposase
MNRGNNGQHIFTCDEDYSYYLEKLADLKIEHPFDLYHYCLMGTHVHILVRIQKETDFSIFSKRLNLSYANYFKRNYGSLGHFWQGRFKSQLIGNDIYFIQCGKYIELNPVRAGLVEKPEDYKWSSYTHYANSERNKIITDDIFYQDFGPTDAEKQKKYAELILPEAVADSMNGKKFAIGSSSFIHNIDRKNKYHIEHKDSPYRQNRA